MTTADLPAVMALEGTVFPDPWPQSAFNDHIQGGDLHALVAEAEDRIVGYACYGMANDEGHLTNIAVDPAWRRKSVAKQLVETILQTVQAGGCEYLLLEVRPGNTAARGFYERLGFKLRGRRSRYYRDPVEDALVLVRYFRRGKEAP